jgi:hypothetical protein
VHGKAKESEAESARVLPSGQRARGCSVHHEDSYTVAFADPELLEAGNETLYVLVHFAVRPANAVVGGSTFAVLGCRFVL